MARPQQLTPEAVRHIRRKDKPQAEPAEQYGIGKRAVAAIQARDTYRHIPNEGEAPKRRNGNGGGAIRRHDRPDNQTLLRLYEQGMSYKEIARKYGVSKGCISSGIARARKNTSPSDAWPRADRGAPAPSLSTTVHSGGGVGYSAEFASPSAERRADTRCATSPAGAGTPAGASSWVKSGKAAGGRRTARQSNRYYGIYGGKRGQHEAARQAAQDRAEGTCAACQQPEPLDATGLCTSCATLVTRADKPGAAWGAEPGHLSRRAGGTEADNVISTEAGL